MLISRNTNEDTQNPQVTLTSPADPQTTREPEFRFLDLPYEIRVLVYVELFSAQTLETFHTSESHSFKKWNTEPDSYIRSPMSFRPVPHEPRSFGLLLANRQCFDEGIDHYHQHSLALNATYLEDWQHEAIFSAHSYAKNQCFIRRTHFYKRTEDLIAVEGIPCNARLVIEATRRIVVDSRIFRIKYLKNYKSLQHVLVRMAHKEFEHWPELQETIPPNTRPTDDQLRYYHEGVLPADEHTRYWKKGIRHRTHMGDQATMENELLMVMQSMPQTTFRVRFPVTYTCEDEEIWEICEYDLRSLELTERKQVAHADIEKGGFYPPIFKDHYSPFNRYS